jgi:hypothetical protein
VRYSFASFPTHFFLEKRTGEDGAWCGLSHDNDLDVMRTRFTYQIEMGRAGDAVRLLDGKKNVIEEKSL